VTQRRPAFVGDVLRSEPRRAFVREYAFELALCVRLEETTDWVVSRQLGGSVADPGGRIVDVVAVVPGRAFDRRAAITADTIPPLALESDVGVGSAVRPERAFDCSPQVARRVADRAVDVGFFEAERRGGHRRVRRAVRYPDDWFAELVAVENKPDLGSPGALQAQLRTDVSLGLFDRVVLATESYVTRAHLNRIPEAVGVWRFDSDSGARTVVREPEPLSPSETGVEPVDSRPLRTDVAFVTADEKARVRRRVAERAYGKGWRPEPAGCVHASVLGDGRPACEHFGRVVDPGADCGEECAAFERDDPPDVDRRALRDERTPWVADPTGVARSQSELDHFV
jgi:hypothetical protein